MRRCLHAEESAEASPVCCADKTCPGDEKIKREDKVTPEKKEKELPPPIVNGRIAFAIFGNVVGCSESNRMAQLSAIRNQQEHVFSVLREKVHCLKDHTCIFKLSKTIIIRRGLGSIFF